MTRLFLSLYYATLGFNIYSYTTRFMEYNINGVDFIMFARPFSSLLIMPWGYLVVVGSALLFCFISIFKQHKVLRVLACVFSVVFFSIRYSDGFIDHIDHIWIFSAIALCFVNTQKKLSSQENLLPLRVTQSLVLSFYFAASLWKLKGVPFFDLQATVLNQIASNIITGHAPEGVVQRFLLFEFPFLAVLGFILVLVFQLSTIIPVITMRYFKYWGIAAIIFHSFSGFAMGIFWAGHVLGLLTLFIFFEILREMEVKGSQHA